MRLLFMALLALAACLSQAEGQFGAPPDRAPREQPLPALHEHCAIVNFNACVHQMTALVSRRR